MKLTTLGWNENKASEFDQYGKQGLVPARVTAEHKGSYKILNDKGSFPAEISGKMHYSAVTREDYPAVGDWVAVEELESDQRAIIHGMLPRTSKFSRKAAGAKTDEQIVAANIDTIFLVTALNHDFNLRRIERYLTMAWESGANPVIILTKSDLAEDADDKKAETESVAFGVPVHAVSSVTGNGLGELKQYVTEGKTVALLGSSGAGKSTLTNKLYGEEIQVTQDVRSGDDRGRHTTTHRELIVLPAGGILIDTPGMRELQLWQTSGDMGQNFADIEKLAEDCQFRDCSHTSEPGCAIKAALQAGTLEEDRYRSYEKLQRELAFIERKNNKRAQLEERKRWKKIAGDRTRFHR